MAVIPYEDFLKSLVDLGAVSRHDPALREKMKATVDGLHELGAITRETLAQFIEKDPHSFPALASCVGLGQEQLKNQLKFRFGTSGWIKLAKSRAANLIKVFDEEFGLVEEVRTQLERDWSFADVLAERTLWSRRTASKAVSQGRSVEDEVESLVKKLGFTYEMRCRFVGRDNQEAPCDLAIPGGGKDALIAIALKSNNSTGSKQTDAVREIEEMANKRQPRQFVYAVFDGIGWLSRESDLRKVYRLWTTKMIDGLYSLAYLDRLEQDLVEAANILRVPRNP